MYRVEFVEKNVDLGEYKVDMERMSLACSTLENVKATINNCLNDDYYVSNIKSGKYDLRIVYVEIE